MEEVEERSLNPLFIHLCIHSIKTPKASAMHMALLENSKKTETLELLGLTANINQSLLRTTSTFLQPLILSESSAPIATAVDFTGHTPVTAEKRKLSLSHGSQAQLQSAPWQQLPTARPKADRGWSPSCTTEKALGARQALRGLCVCWTSALCPSRA